MVILGHPGVILGNPDWPGIWHLASTYSLLHPGVILGKSRVLPRVILGGVIGYYFRVLRLKLDN